MAATGAAVGSVPTAGTAGAGVADDGVVEVAVVIGCGPLSIFSVFGPWSPSTASRITAPTAAIFFCLASLAFSGSTLFAAI